MLVRFRQNQVALHGDISKMYHSVKTGPAEKYMRLMAWEKADGEIEFFGPDVIMFGDQTATNTLEECKNLAADNGDEIDEMTANAIRENMYSDDLLTGGEEDEVHRMMGDCTVAEDGSLSYSGTLPHILAEAGFKMKMMIRSGTNPPEALEKMGDGVLGHVWNPLLDTFAFPFVFHQEKRDKLGEFENEPLSLVNLDTVDPTRWTRRTCLSASASQYDPSGLTSPVSIRLRIFLREQLSQPDAKWDTPFPKKWW